MSKLYKYRCLTFFGVGDTVLSAKNSEEFHADRDHVVSCFEQIVVCDSTLLI